jgi:hypothetical protein
MGATTADLVVAGAGHNALAVGAYLAKAFGTPIGGRLPVA